MLMSPQVSVEEIIGRSQSTSRAIASMTETSMFPIPLPHILVLSTRPPRRRHAYGTNLLGGQVLYGTVARSSQQHPAGVLDRLQSSLPLRTQFSAPSAQHLATCLGCRLIPSIHTCMFV